MEKREAVQPDDYDTGTWLLAIGQEAGKGYLGRVSKLDHRDAYAKIDLAASLPEAGGVKMKLRTEVSVDEVLKAAIITLCPVYDYREIVKEVPLIKDGKMVQDPNVPGIPASMPMRTPLVMQVGFTVVHAPLHIHRANYDFRFLSQMDTRDAATYIAYARDTREMMNNLRLQASGLAQVTQDDIERAARSKA